MKKDGGKKGLIMETAKNLFAERGYDAASMDEIALRSGVPKSLIYYHFKGKDDLLHAIMDKFILEYEQLLDPNNSEILGTERYFHFLYANRDFVKIIIMESLKNKKEAVICFEVINKIMQYEGNYHKTHRRFVAEFFTSIIPFAMFVCYADNWCDHFETDIESAKEDFISVFKQTHGNYHELLGKGEIL